MKEEQVVKLSSDKKLGTEKIGKLMFTMGMPALVAQVINLLYNIVDRIYIGHIEGIGSDALTGVGLSLPIIIIITAFSAFVGSGGAPLAAIALGKGDNEKANKILGNGVTILLGFSVILTTVFLIIKEPFLYLIGGSDVIMPYANDYITIYLYGTIFVQITVGLNTFITAQGRSKTAMVSVLIGAIINIVLDPIFIFGFNMGVKGAALATIISQAVSAVWVIHFLVSDKATLRIKPKFLKPDVKIMLSVAALGVSPFIMQATESLISIVMNSGLQSYGGDLYVGSLVILQSAMQFISVPMNGFAQGIQPIMSYNYGAGNISRVKQTFKYTLIIMVGYAVSITLLAMIFPAQFAMIFTNSEELIALVTKVLPIFIFGMLIFGIQMTCQATFMALGQAKVSLIMALLRKVFLLIPLVIILPMITNNVMGIYYAEPIADIVAATVCGIVFIFKFNKILKKTV